MEDPTLAGFSEPRLPPSSGEGTQGVIRVGVAGWDYPDWRGIVYPTTASRRFDRLAYLARFVDVVEINSSFYRPVDARRASSWVRRCSEPPGFRFTAKGYRGWTHEPDADPAETVPAALDGLVPLREAGMLGALLLQFPQSFHRTPHAFLRLERLLRTLEGWPLIVEVRHVSWDSDQAAIWFRDRGVGWCVVDQPDAGRSTAPAHPRATSSIGYLRLHGRNAGDWFREGAGRDARYNYLYRSGEMRTLAGLARALAHAATEVFVVQNNHFRGQAVANALQMKHLLGHPRPRAPQTLVEAYPQLVDIVASEPSPGRLF